VKTKTPLDSGVRRNDDPLPLLLPVVICKRPANHTFAGRLDRDMMVAEGN
jgi:hypothetical protein